MQVPCSTPYGNQRKITCLPWPILGTICSCSTPYGNQRKITRGPDSGSGGGSLGAQRLTAIRGKSPLLELPWVPLKLSCSTPYGNQRKITSYSQSVISFVFLCSTPYGNQRKITCPSPSWLLGRVLCSTPYGNQRKITRKRLLKLSCRFVLNALRQSEENHSAPQDPYSARLGWSLCKHVPLFYTPTAS